MRIISAQMPSHSVQQPRFKSGTAHSGNFYTYVNIKTTGYTALGLMLTSLAALIGKNIKLHKYTAIGSVIATIAHFVLCETGKRRIN